MVPLTATAATGFAFSGWSGGCSGTGTCTVTMSSDQVVGATFVPAHSLTVSLAGSGSGSVSGSAISCPATCSASYPTGTMVTLTATPATGSAFSGWSGGGCSGTGTCTVTLASDQAVTATFAASPHTLSSPPPSLTITAPPNGATHKQSQHVLAAAPTLTSLSETAKTWREGNALAQLSAKKNKKKLPVGTTFSFALSEQASVTFTFTQSASGRKAGKSCVPPTKKNRKEHRCTRVALAGTLTFTAHAGTNKVRFEGPISTHKRLKPGSYAVSIIATASGKQSAPGTLHFTIANG
jgi:hypothetical protein